MNELMNGETELLGHVINAEGKSLDDGKVQVILNWPAPTNATEVSAFLGLAGYYRHFVHHFSHIADPLTTLLSKTVPWTWGPDQEAAFKKLKHSITTTPVLAYPDPEKPFVLTTDASGRALGGVISQDHGKGLQPIAFYSRKLTPAERNYPTHDREMLALIASLKHWRHYLMGAARSRAYTDHQALRHFATQPHLSPRQTRWMGTLQEYDVYIDYLPGKTNVVADALSRRPDLLNSIISTSTDFLANLPSRYGGDDESRALKQRIQQQQEPNCRLQHGLIIRTDGDKTQLYIPPAAEELRRQLISEHHDTPIAGHLGMDKTIDCLERNYWWPTLRSDVRRHVQTCPCCQISKSRNRKPLGLLQPLPIPERKWEQTTMDFITQLPKTPRGYDAIMVVVDKLTKMVHLTATHTTATAPSTAELYFNNISRLHGLQSSIVSDRDSKFTSRFWEALMELFGTKLKRSTAYHPQTDGQTERTNRTLEEILRAYVSDRHDDWDTRLAPAELAINNAVNSSTKQTPFYLNYGYHPLTPATLGVHRLHGSTNQVATEFYQRMQTDLEAARQQLAAAQQRQAHYANLKRQDAAFDVGDRVLLSTANLRLRIDGPASKFNVKWTGPFTILERVGAVAYRLDLPATMKIHPVFHISLLKPYFHDETTPERQETQLRPPPIIYY